MKYLHLKMFLKNEIHELFVKESEWHIVGQKHISEYFTWIENDSDWWIINYTLYITEQLHIKVEKSATQQINFDGCVTFIGEITFENNNSLLIEVIEQ